MKLNQFSTSITASEVAAANEAYSKEFPLTCGAKPKSVTILARYFEILWDLFHDPKITNDAAIVRILSAIPSCPLNGMAINAAVGLVADFRKHLGILRKEHSQLRSQETTVRRAIQRIDNSQARIERIRERAASRIVTRNQAF